jgi:hypothetical protein
MSRETKPYDGSYQQPARKSQRKWRPPVRYARDGYRYICGEYVKLTPRATGVTHIFSTNRHERRAEAKALAIRNHARRKAKALGRERFERARYG